MGRLNEQKQQKKQDLNDRARELEEANRRLRELDLLKNEFISIASHELHSPLASMKMGVSTVLKEIVGPLNAEQRIMLAVADRNIDRLNKLTSDLLDLTKIEIGQLELEFKECDLVEIVGEVVESAGPQAEHLGLDIEIDPDARQVLANCDRDRIYQVIQNMVVNAIKFTDEGSVNISVCREGENIKVCVKDTGIGIPPEAMDTLFEKFSQAHLETESEKRGTGLGLAICKGIVEAHGGQITARNEPGGGSEFCISIPARGPDERTKKDTDSR